jgi:hypothetical protein
MNLRLILATTLLAGGCSSAPPTLLDRLQDPVLANAAFQEAIASVCGRIVHEERFEDYRLAFGGARPLRFESGDVGAVVFLRGKGAPCGNGIRDGGVEAPRDLVPDHTLQGILVLDGRGAPLYQVDASRSLLAVVDVDGDGQAQELLRWRSWCDYDRPPFLAIHDLSRPGAPLMIRLDLNPQSGRESTEFIHDTLVDPDGKTWYRTRISVKRHPDQSGRWRLGPPADQEPNVIIEQSLSGELAEVARFCFDRHERVWIGPAGSDRQFWKRGGHPWMGATFTNYAAKPN